MKQILFFCVSVLLFVILTVPISDPDVLSDIENGRSVFAQNSVSVKPVSDTNESRKSENSLQENTTNKSDLYKKSQTKNISNKSKVSTKSEESSAKKLISPLDRQNLESVNKSLKKKKYFPWYSNKNGQLKFLPPVPDKPAKAPSNNQNTFNWDAIFNCIFWIILIVIFIFLVFAVILIVFHLKENKTDEKNENHDQTDDLQRQRESLPIEAAQQIGSLDLLAESSLKEGDFRKAIIYHFSWLLIELDRKKIIHLQNGKTNRQFLSEIKFRDELAALYSHVMDLFEKTYYGARPISEEDFMTVWQERDLLCSEMNKPAQNAPMFPPQNSGLPKRNFYSFFLIVFMAAVFCLMSCAGCQSKYWQEEYETNYLSKSINGISIFRDMIESRKHEVTVKKSYCDNPDDYDVIFWFSNDLSNPRMEYNLLSQSLVWLHGKEGRKLFFILPDYRADYDFWSEIKNIAPPDQQEWVKEKINSALINESLAQKNFENQYNKDLKEDVIRYKENKKNDQRKKEKFNTSDEAVDKKKSDNSDSHKSSVPGISREDLSEFMEYLSKNNTEDDLNNQWICQPLKKVETSSVLTGPVEWTGGLEPEFPYRFTRKTEPRSNFQTLAAAGEYPLILRKVIGKSDLYIISSRAFLLNYPLLKKDRQILAGRLINSLGQKPQNVLLELGWIHFSSHKNRPKPLPAIFSTKPFAILFWHLLFWTVLLTFRAFPILGRPREIPPEERADFSKHLTAFAELLEKTGNRAWAEKNIGLYLKQKENEQTRQ